MITNWICLTFNRTLVNPHDRDDIDIDLGQIAEIMGRIKEFLDQVDFDLMNTGRGLLE
jgi:hypothetical protein